MSRLENRSQLMKYLGAKQKNVVWSWCAVDEESRKVYFSLWADSAEKRDGQRLSYVVQKPHWGINKETGSHSAARKDHDEKLSLVFDQGFEAFGYLIDPKDPKAKQREIGGIRTSFIISLKLERREDGFVLDYPLTRDRAPLKSFLQQCSTAPCNARPTSRAPERPVPPDCIIMQWQVMGPQ